MRDTEKTSATRVLGWGIYCASSWTWCIGMFLPIILLRLFGWPGFLVFAIPNLIGLVAIGYLCNAERCRAILREHRPAIRLFSAATVAFQLFFLAWAWSTFAPNTSATSGALIALGVWLLGLALAAVGDRAWVVLGVLTWLCSAVLFLWFLLAHDGGGLATMPASGELTLQNLVELAPAFLFGFLLCPWLDGTFLRARIQSGSPHTFAIFGIFFFPMILFTCAYTIGGEGLFVGLVLTQLTVQASFTTAVHTREAWLGGFGAKQDRSAPWPWAALLPGLAILLGTLPLFANESTYLRFLGLYGLIFPAYVLLFILRSGGTTPRRSVGALFLFLMLPCAVMYDWAFISRATSYAAITVAGLLALAMLIVLTSRTPTSRTNHAQ